MAVEARSGGGAARRFKAQWRSCSSSRIGRARCSAGRRSAAVLGKRGAGDRRPETIGDGEIWHGGGRLVARQGRTTRSGQQEDKKSRVEAMPARPFRGPIRSAERQWE